MPSEESADTAERLNDLGHLAAGVGHHVINAFSAVVSNAEILRLTGGKSDPADPFPSADRIVKAAMEASAVARRLIDFSRATTSIGPDRVALDDLVRRVVEAEQNGGRGGIEWRTDLGRVPLVRGNDLQLRAMLGHLLLNAYEAIPPSGGTISISTSVDPRGWVAVEIRDTGQGMGAEARARAVEPFFTTKPGRFGVGLTIANGIWRRHRGTLALQSQPGEGTRIRLCIDPTVEPAASPTLPR